MRPAPSATTGIQTGIQTAAEVGFLDLAAQGKRALRHVAAVTITRWALFQRLSARGLPLVETGTGGGTTWTRREGAWPAENPLARRRRCGSEYPTDAAGGWREYCGRC